MLTELLAWYIKKRQQKNLSQNIGGMDLHVQELKSQNKKEKPNSCNLLIKDLLNKRPWELLYQFMLNKWESKSCFLKEVP